MSWRDRIAKALTGIRAYHSSPHDFDRFDASKIGTGEGAQVYGHGLYFAENPAVSGQGGQYWNQFRSRFPADEQNAATFLSQHKFDRAAAIREMQDNIKFFEEKAKGFADPLRRRDFEVRAAGDRAALDLLQRGGPVGPRTYEVDIKARPELFLDWDKPIGQQSPQVREVANALRVPDKSHVKGEQAYWHLGGEALDTGKVQHGVLAHKYASEQLRDAGIPGIRYLDQGSRQHQQDILDAQRFSRMGPSEHSKTAWAERAAELQKTPVTSNYVVFDPGIIDIVKKYGVVGAPAGMGALAAQDKYEARQ